MVRDWDKWNEFGVTKFLSKKQLNDIMKRNPDQKIVGTRCCWFDLRDERCWTCVVRAQQEGA